MPVYQIMLDPTAASFYERVAAQFGRTTEQILADALFQLAGELSLEALSRRES